MKADLLIPVRRARPAPGRLVWPDAPVLASASTDDRLPLDRLAQTLRRTLDVRPRLAENAFGPAAVRVRRAKDVVPREGYRLRVSDAGVEVEARTSSGAFYGLQTLRELVRVHGRTLPGAIIDDRPDFDRRGVYLDCSRGKVPTVETLVALVERLASWKLNELQLYLENVFTWRRHPAIGRGYDPYRPEDLLAVQDACRRFHVRLVPSLASFGHVERVLGLPPYRHLAEKPGHLGLPGGTTLCPGDPGSIRLVAELWEEVLPLFEADEVNACGDETWELGRGRSRRRAARLGVGRVYVDFLRKLHRLANRHGKRMAIWADILLEHPETLPDLPPDVVLLNWEYGARGPRIGRTREIAEADRTFLVCPGTSSWQSHGTRLGNAVENVRRFAAEGRRRGAAGLLNTDWGDYGHRNLLGASLHGLAHGAAHAWCGRGVDEAGFADAFVRHGLGRREERLVAAIRRLGAADEVAGASLYHAVADPLDPYRDAFVGIPALSPVRIPAGYRRRPIEDADEDGCRLVIEEATDAATWRSLARGLAPFDRRSVEDLAAADRMNALAARRILLGRALREGRAVTSGDLRAQARETSRTARALERAWLRRNRPSRLRDNLRLYHRAREECVRAAAAR